MASTKKRGAKTPARKQAPTPKKPAKSKNGAVKRPKKVKIAPAISVEATPEIAPAPASPQPVDLDETILSSRQATRETSSRAVAFDRPASVVVISHPEDSMLGQRFELMPAQAVTIGRAHDSDIVLDLREVSRRHARIVREADDVYVEDVGSRNGTFVRGEMVRHRTKLTHGDTITIESIHLRFISGSNIEHAYHEAIYDLAMRDDLTQIYNRRKYDNEAERDFARAVRHKRQLALILFDVDKFKDINDHHGHLFGDAVLQQIAQLVSKMLRREEVFARAGGDEFLILCPEVGIAGAAILAERLRVAIAGHEFRRGEVKMKVTCSFGVAELGPGMKNVEELYAAADAHLYTAKSRGRNGVGVDRGA